MSDIRRWITLCEADDFADAPPGTIISVAPDDKFGSMTYAMKMANGDWHAVTAQGPKRGVEQYTLGDQVIDVQMLRTAAPRISGLVQGIRVGDRIKTGVQVLALPIGSIVGNPNPSLGQYTRQEQGMVAQDGKVIPEWAFGSDNAVWKAETLGEAAYRRYSVSDYERILNQQRELESLRAAMRDPKTGKVYVGSSHQAAIDKVPPSDETGAWGRLSTEWEKGSENTGYVDTRTGEFISRDEAERRWDVLTVEDIRDKLRAGRQRESLGEAKMAEDMIRLPVVYHVTETKNVRSIRKHGLQRMMTSNWVQAGSNERYGNGEVFAFENEQDAIRWGGRMDWDLHQGTGTKKISIITVHAPEHEWSVDHSDPLSQAGARGRWLKSEMPVPPEAISKVTPITVAMIRAMIQQR